MNMDLEKELAVLQELQENAKYRIREFDLGHTVIKNFKELEAYILDNRIEGNEMAELIQKATRMIVDPSKTAVETIKDFKSFMEQYPYLDGLEIPLFIA
jgi:hypothetical protein